MKQLSKGFLTVFILALSFPLAVFAAGELDIGTILSTVTAFKQPQVLAFAAFAVAGVLVHVEWDIKKGIITAPDGGSWFATLFNYMVKQRLMNTLYMILGAAALGTAYLAMTPQPISWIQLVIAGATAGYTSDSLFNRGA